MRSTPKEIQLLLLYGSELKWIDPSTNIESKIKLDNPLARRLAQYIFSSTTRDVTQLDQNFLNGLKEAFQRESDPAKEIEIYDQSSKSDRCWVLHSICTENYGGINKFSGEKFSYTFDGETTCIDGQNGSGKTSFVSAIIWCLTGYIYKDQLGVVNCNYEEAQIFNPKTNEKIGSWPSIVSLPNTISILPTSYRLSVTLVFKDLNSGEYSEVSRSYENGKESYNKDNKFRPDERLINIGLEMPCRLANIKFSQKEDDLYESIKSLTGYEGLTEIAEFISAMSHKNRGFSNYSKKEKIENYDKNYRDYVSYAIKELDYCDKEMSNSIGKLARFNESPKLIELQNDALYLDELLETTVKSTAEFLEQIQEYIPSKLDIDDAQIQKQIIDAVQKGRFTIDGINNQLSVIQLLTKLSNLDASDVEALENKVSELIESLNETRKWKDRQESDSKLIIKIVAAKWHKKHHPEIENIEQCPICERSFDDPEYKEIAEELKELKEAGELAEQEVKHACASLASDVYSILPDDIKTNQVIIKNLRVRDDYINILIEEFINKSPFKDVLIGIPKIANEHIDRIKEGGDQEISDFEYIADVRISDIENHFDDNTFKKLIETMFVIDKSLKLSIWWKENRTKYVESWNNLTGKPDTNNKVRDDSIKGHLLILEDIINKAEPYKKANAFLDSAKINLEKYKEILEEQIYRDEVIKQIECIKDLSKYVEVEIKSLITTLSDNIQQKLEDIYLKDKLEFGGAHIEKKTVNIDGIFGEVGIDARHIANTSWIRLVLWCFIFTIREETFKNINGDRLSLLLIDDPTYSLDIEHRRRWAAYVIDLANKPISDSNFCQLVMLTYDSNFIKELHAENFKGDSCIADGITDTTEHMSILNGKRIDLVLVEAKEKNDDYLARQYISDLRVYIETNLKLMLRTEGSVIRGKNISSLLRDHLKPLINSNVPPHNREIFSKLRNQLEGSTKIMMYTNGPHHCIDQSIGVAQAIEVEEEWKKLKGIIDSAFDAYREFRLFLGDPRLFTHEPAVIDWNDENNEILAQNEWERFGSVAALTDGRISIEQIYSADEDKIRLVKHTAFRLNKNTLEGIASPGDILITKNFGNIDKNSIVICILGATLLARRYSSIINNSTLKSLVAHTVDPAERPEDVLIDVQKTPVRMVVGVIFSSDLSKTPNDVSEAHEISETGELSNIINKIQGAFVVKGKSAEPLALDGQSIFVGEKITNINESSIIDNKLALIELDNGEWYLKRIHLTKDRAVLQSIQNIGEYPPIIVSLKENSDLPIIKSVTPVIGVLYQ